MAIDVSPDPSTASPEPSRRLARVSRQIAADVSPPPSPGSPSLDEVAVSLAFNVVRGIDSYFAQRGDDVQFAGSDTVATRTR